ncbi:proteinase-activated receptor 4-like [Amia ocellicauda]|uniref:proteinase-activated receptor 4-like n=1 Tax=Amia ocellicauda TaxID=2972642 RepID=UPI003463B82F
MRSLLFGQLICIGFISLSWTGLLVKGQECKDRSFTLQSGCENGVIVNTLNKTTENLLTDQVSTLIIPILYTVVVVVGLPANILALWVLLTKVKRLPGTILLINLAIADVLLLLFLPFKIVYYFMGSRWIFGEAMCRVVTAAFYGNMYGSILCLMFISIYRYISVVHPFSVQRIRSKKLAISVSIMTWAIAVAAMVPFVAIKQSYHINNTSMITCHDALPTDLKTNLFAYYFTSLTAFGFILPFLSILICYVSIICSLSRQKKSFARTVKICAIVLTVFMVCYIPSHVILLLHYNRDQVLQDSRLYRPYMVSLVLSTFNSSIDPFLYLYVSDHFRANVTEVLSREVVSNPGPVEPLASRL